MLYIYSQYKRQGNNEIMYEDHTSWSKCQTLIIFPFAFIDKPKANKIFGSDPFYIIISRGNQSVSRNPCNCNIYFLSLSSSEFWNYPILSVYYPLVGGTFEVVKGKTCFLPFVVICLETSTTLRFSLAPDLNNINPRSFNYITVEIIKGLFYFPRFFFSC